ncbi:MAG: hypothetical protein JSW27_01865 [Phycisphaerales bacterium]|nr:MAG: hypothetical protein JSW27_01865 [Phycisphaerales bacterium]
MATVKKSRIRGMIVWASSCAVALILGILIGSKNHVPFVGHVETWSIGVYEGTSAFDLSDSAHVANPVLTAADVSDIDAAFVADPFVIFNNSTYHMFFEVWNSTTGHGDIALAISSDGFRWDYQEVVIDEPFHLSYPYVFNWEGEYYLIPESEADRCVRLYKAVSFPREWELQATLLWGYHFTDPSIFRYDDRWWLFTSFAESDVLRLYHADQLEGPWTEHPQNPIIREDPNIARSGGRILQFDGRMFRFAQDDYPTYGNQLRAFEITDLTRTTYEEEPVSSEPILQGSGVGWNRLGMHHADHHFIDGRWVVYVDGTTVETVFGWKY